MTHLASPPRLRVELSGHPRLARPDGSTLPLEPRDGALLALIALEGPVGRERVQSLLWADADRKVAQGNLRQRLFRLRKKAEAELVAGDGSLTLAPNVGHDLHEPDVPETLLGDLRFEGDELSGWVDAMRERRRRDASERLAANASQFETEGALAQAIELAERLVEREADSEHAHRRLMRLHYRRGDRSAALSAYRRCRESLDHLLGAAPSTETEALARTIERSGSLSEPSPAPSPAPPPITLLRPPRLIGRQAVWQAWESAWQRDHIVVIGGEPGIGKSRLLGDFAAAVGAGDVLRAHPGDTQMPHTTWARWLRAWRRRFGPSGEAWVEGELARLVPGIAGESDAPFAPLRFRQACFDALAGWFEGGCTRVVIDDLHYADEASLEVLLAWCSQGPRQHIAMAARSAEMPAALVAWLDAQRGREQVLELTLDALTGPEIAELIESLELPGLRGSAWAGELARNTGGNPFFMIELLRASHLADGTVTAPAAGQEGLRAPPHLGRLLAQRLNQLPPEALRLARIAGLAGVEFSAELAAAMLGVQPIDLADAWATLERTQIFRDGAFAHDLMLESAAATVPEALAKTLHGAIAKALDPTHVGPARIAHHALEAGEWAFAATMLEAAAVEAFAAVRHREVVQFHDRARDCHKRLGDARAAFRVGCRIVESARHFESEAALDARTLALMEAAEGDAEEMAACNARAEHLATTYHIEELVPPAERALDLARRLEDREAELTAAGHLANAFCATGRHQEGLDLMQAPSAHFDAMAESHARFEFAMAYAVALSYVGRGAEAVRWCERSIASGEQLGRADDLAVHWANMAFMRWQIGRVGEAVEAGRRSLALHMRHDDGVGSTPIYTRLVLANCLKRVDGWDEAESLLEQALAAARSGAPALIPVIQNQLATLYLELGQYARSRKLLAQSPPPAAGLLRRAVIESRLDAASGRADAARLTALMAEHRYGEGGQTFERLANQVAVALASPAQVAIPICHALWTEAEQLGSKAIALTTAARLASASREAAAYDDALHWARVALAEAPSVVAYDMDAPEFCWHLHQGLSQREPEEALALVRQALERVRCSLPRIPEPYRESYWNRSPFVPRLRAIVARGASSAPSS